MQFSKSPPLSPPPDNDGNHSYEKDFRKFSLSSYRGIAGAVAAVKVLGRRGEGSGGSGPGDSGIRRPEHSGHSGVQPRSNNRLSLSNAFYISFWSSSSDTYILYFSL